MLPGDTPETSAAPGDGAGRVEAPAPGRADDFRRDREGESRMNVYENHDLAALLAGNTYPGRGIVLGKTADGKQCRRRLFHHGPQREQPQPGVCSRSLTASVPRPLIRRSWPTPASSSTIPCVSWATRPDRHQRRPDRHHPGSSGTGQDLRAGACAPARLSRTAPTGPPASPACSPPTAAISCPS